MENGFRAEVSSIGSIHDKRATIHLSQAFTLIELLVVVTILAVLAAILFPVFSAAKGAAKGTACLSNLRQIGMANALYLADANDRYPQCRRSSSQPERDDATGATDEPDYGSYFGKIQPYAKSAGLFACPDDADPTGRSCMAANPDTPDLASYLVNAGFLFGLSASGLSDPAGTVQFAERRTEFCDYAYHPWFDAAHPLAPEDQMDGKTGAVATRRHQAGSDFGFADGHAKFLGWSQTYAPPRVDLHAIGRG